MEAVVLAGGLGTRMRNTIADLPKPMAPVGGRPFLAYVLDGLKEQGVSRAVLAVGYRREAIQDCFGDAYNGVSLLYSVEDRPLLTGGAIKQALALCGGDTVFVMNGDTYFDVPLGEMAEFHANNGAELTVATHRMHDFDRYGTVRTDGCDRITGFTEKRRYADGMINGGIYLMDRHLLDAMPEVFSFENGFMEQQVCRGTFFAFASEGYFIDIGVPEDYERAQTELAEKRTMR